MVDKIFARDMALTLGNDSRTYYAFTQPYTVNLAKKKLKGIFKKSLALKGLVTNFQRLKKRYFQITSPISARFDKATKEYFAKEFYDLYLEEAINDVYKGLKKAKKKIPKKKSKRR